MILLKSFDRAKTLHSGEVVRERVKCHLWFASGQDMDAFIEAQRGGVEVPSPGTQDKKERWPEFFSGPSP